MCIVFYAYIICIYFLYVCMSMIYQLVLVSDKTKMSNQNTGINEQSYETSTFIYMQFFALFVKF